MPQSTYKVIEVIGTSPKSWDEAAKNAVERVAESVRDLRVAEVVTQDLVITDSILPSEAVRNAHNIRVLPVAPLLGEAIARTAEEKSVSSLFY